MFKRIGQKTGTHSLAARFICLALALSVLGAMSARAQAKSAKDILLGGLGSGLSKGASWGAGFLLNAIAGGLYAGYCGHDQVNDAAGELLCMAAGKVTGQDEKEWKAEVKAKLKTLHEQLATVQAGQDELNEAIERQSGVLREALKNLPVEVKVEGHLSNIQDAWAAFNDYFLHAEPKSPEATRESLRKLARRLIETYEIDRSASALRDAIIEGRGRESVPLPLMLAKQIDSWPRAQRKPEEWDGKDPEDFDVRPLYLELELAMRQWILRQQQAQVLYLWSARALEGTPDAPLLTVAEYRKSYAANIEKQLESFQRAVEWLVLANSFPRSPFANFLPSHAEEVFARADAFQALTLSTSDEVAPQSAGQAIWGRVIALGPGSAGSALTLKSPNNSPLPLKASLTKSVQLQGWPELDGWSASNPAQPLVFDRIDFASEWTVYRFKQPLGNKAKLGDYRFAPGDAGNALPYLPPIVRVDDSLGEITGRASERFGSFVGIARAGGAYALFSGEFDQQSSESWGQPSKLNVKTPLIRVPSASDLDTSIDQRKRIQRVDTARGMPRPIVGEAISTRDVRTRGVNPITGSNRVWFSVDRERSLLLRSRKTIRSRSGELLELRLNVIWNEDALGSPFGRPSGQVLAVAHDREGILSSEASFNSTLKLTLGAPGSSPVNGVGVTIQGKSGRPEDRHADRMAGQRDEGRAHLPAAGHRLEIVEKLNLNLPFVPNVRTWTWLARASWQTAYLSR